MRNWLYYHLKPSLPWGLRMALRRLLAGPIRSRTRDAWPILEAAGRPPAGWPGWPEGKKFAFVLTHDVEGPGGLEKVRALAELEQSLGFRSCFNFIPEGPYRVSPDLREWLVQRGFEVGVHDLAHDGKLFASRTTFCQRARTINHYLKEWQAEGFRAGFMHHDLEWQHDLEMQYDCSTFDTDPFEPQPHGVSTIFPFWVPAPSEEKSEVRSQKSEVRLTSEPEASSLRTSNFEPRTSNFEPRPSARGYVELPYTLPQDSTLFLLFREQNIAIWQRKLDWIAQQGGMALVNVHPDYVCFNGAPRSPREYPVAFYRELLRYVQERYAGDYWNALPRAVAAHTRAKVQT